jgi:RNA polymerase sigma-70 factor (ECF subfamily)
LRNPSFNCATVAQQVDFRYFSGQSSSGIFFVRKCRVRSLFNRLQKQPMSGPEQEAIFRRWLEVHAGLLFKVVRGCAATPQDQDDLFQDVLVQLWSSIPSFRGDAKETTWIYRVAFNTALAWQRQERRRRKGHEAFIKFDVSPQTQPSHVDNLPQKEIVEKLYAAIRQLPKVDVSLALMHLDGLSYQEMAEVLGISENYIGVKLNRIRKQLAEQLTGAADEF